LLSRVDMPRAPGWAAQKCACASIRLQERQSDSCVACQRERHR